MFGGKGYARRRQREKLEANGYDSATVQEGLSDGGGLFVLKGEVQAGSKTLVVSRHVPANAPKTAVRVERAIRTELARLYAIELMGEPEAIEYESFPGSGTLGGSSGGARDDASTSEVNTGSAYLSAGSEASGAGDTPSAPPHESSASVLFTSTGDGVTFTIDFHGREFDPNDPAHRTAAEVLPLLAKLGGIDAVQQIGAEGVLL